VIGIAPAFKTPLARSVATWASGRRRLLLFAWCSLITLLAYGPALGLPFFFDDFVHLPFVDNHTFAELWQTAGRLAYFRPLNFALWKTLNELVGRHDPLLYHAVNLLLHLCNGFLVGSLAARLWPAERAREENGRAFLAATLFLLFPLSYQAVPWVGSLSHLLATFLILWSVLVYCQWRQTGNPAFALLSLCTALLALFTHENGVLLVSLLLLVEVTETSFLPTAWRQWARPLLWLLPLVVWLPIWWAAPKAAGELSLNGTEPLLQNSAYFLQGIAYPLTWIGGWLALTFGFNDLLLALFLAAVALIIAAAIQWRGGAGRRSWLPWLWCGLSVAPAVLLLSFDYVINGPRLLMLAAAGAAWLWSDVILRSVLNLRRAGVARRRLVSTLVPLLVALLIVQNLTFIRQRLEWHRLLGTVVVDAVALTRAANATGDQVLFINFPSWIAPPRATFPLGHEGVLFWPDYALPPSLVEVHSGQPARLSFGRVEAIRPHMPYFYQPAGVSPDWPLMATGRHQVFVAEYGETAISLRPAGRFGVVPVPAPPIATFLDESGKVAAYLLAAEARYTHDGATLHLTWQLDRPLVDVTVFVHLVESGRLAYQADGDPLGGSYPFSLWTSEQAVEDVRRLKSAAVPEVLLVGLYSRMDGGRLPALTANGEFWPEAAVSLDVYLKSE
jgi:hypothetical protein